MHAATNRFANLSRLFAVAGCGVVLGAVASARVGQAGPVVQNASFELPFENGGYTTSATDWTITGYSGNFQGVDSKSGAGLSGANGPQYFFGDGATSSNLVSQDLGVGFAPYTTYTVDLSSAVRTSCCGGQDLTFGLASSTAAPLPGAVTGYISVADIVAGVGYNKFVDAATAGPNSHEFTFTTGATVPSGDIVAYFSGAGNASTYGNRVTADDFTLTVVPEPSSCMLFGLGAVGLLLAARRRRKA